MTQTELRDIAPSATHASRDVGIYMAQLDEQSRQLATHLRGISAEELQWQSAPGMNTIGMLLAHLALTELWWTDLVLRDIVEPDSREILGVGMYDDGMPTECAPEFTAPAHLSGKTWEYFEDLLKRSRDHLKLAARGLTDDDLAKPQRRTCHDGVERTLTARWTLHHLLAHIPWHGGQMVMIRHQYRDR